ncbi:MAG: bifunctional UDP-N-acetylglucosamine diphosphorylase/glucosamine-1-phosphate N-acetyltransferase GlmU [Bryobacteraceae bacterium]
MSTPVTVLVLAAGLGTRMKSRRAKVLHRAGGLTLVEHVVDTAASVAPPERIIVVVGHQAEQVKGALEGLPVRFVEQREQRGTGDAVLACREAVGPPEGLIVVLCGDCPLLTAGTLNALVERQRGSSAAATMLTVMLEDPTGYGRIVRGSDGGVEAIVEQKAATPEQLAIREVNSAIYCFRADLLWEHIGNIRPDNPAREYYLTDIVALFRRAGHRVDTICHTDPQELGGINTRVELAAADRVLRERTARRLMLAGVTILKPETVTIDPRVKVGVDTVIEPFAQILGRTSIGEDCRIGACSIIQDSELGNRVVVGPLTIVADSRLEDEVQAGPFARLRPGNHMAKGSRVGNFVEMKKASLGAGSKAQHLAYLGDSVIGAGTNIGAGTITCNYDGVKKHPTRIGDGAFIGSNSTLVAPVEIGDGSYVGAGSVVTENVPEDALALGRGQQVNKLGWAKRRREKQER